MAPQQLTAVVPGWFGGALGIQGDPRVLGMGMAGGKGAPLTRAGTRRRCSSLRDWLEARQTDPLIMMARGIEGKYSNRQNFPPGC